MKGNTDPNSLYYSDLTGDLVKNQFYKLGDSWYYAGTDGKRLKGAQTVYGNQKVFFEYDGRQVKGEFASDGNYYDKDNGLLVDLPRNQFIYLNKRWYY
ncbi:MAG: glucosyl transferase, partial [Streptococcus sp.]